MAEEDLAAAEFDDGEMHWEIQARRTVKECLQHIRFDELRGVIYAMSGEDHRFNRVEEEFQSWDEMVHRLAGIYDQEWYANVSFDGGRALFESDSYGAVSDMLADLKVEDFFDRMRAPKEGEELADAKQLIIPAGGLIVETDLAEVNDELVKYLAKHPELMHQMEPRKFEELIAELLKAKGYDVEVTKRTRDGGLDIRAFRKSEVGTLLTMTQCKRYAPARKVTVEAVRQLYGVVESDKATSGLIVTTSTFTLPAKTFQEQNKYHCWAWNCWHRPRGRLCSHSRGKNRLRAPRQNGPSTNCSNHHCRHRFSVRTSIPSFSRKRCTRGALTPCVMAETSTTTVAR